MQIVYNVSPLVPAIEFSLDDRFSICDREFNFWDFLNLPVKKQLDELAIRL